VRSRSDHHELPEAAVSCPDRGPLHWAQPSVLPVYLNGRGIAPIEQLTVTGSEAGVGMGGLDGTYISHRLLEDALQPLGVPRIEVSMETTAVAESAWQALDAAHALCQDGQAKLFVGAPVLVTWRGNGSASALVLPHAMPYGSVPGATLAAYPVAATVGDYPDGARAAWTIVTSAPSGAQVQVDDTADAVSVTLGQPLGEDETLELSYYPLLRVELLDDSKTHGSPNSATRSTTFSSFVPTRAWS
jgi:hypothetical protein